MNHISPQVGITGQINKGAISPVISYYRGTFFVLLLATAPQVQGDENISLPSEYSRSLINTTVQKSSNILEREMFIEKYPYINLLLSERMPEHLAFDSIIYEIFAEISKGIAFDTNLIQRGNEEQAYRKEKKYPVSIALTRYIQEVQDSMKKWKEIRETFLDGMGENLNPPAITEDVCVGKLEIAIRQYADFYASMTAEIKQTKIEIMKEQEVAGYTNDDILQWRNKEKIPQKGDIGTVGGNVLYD
ncbi:MAG: hypothetical protein WC774_03380 [Candidatus Gracilibacteria bacterium]